MSQLTFADIGKALPADESRSSHGTYKSYLNKMGCIGYKEDLASFLLEPMITADKLKDAGVDLKDAANIFKALKYCASKAERFLNMPFDMVLLENYKTEILDKVYGVVKKGAKKAAVVSEVDDESVTEIDDELIDTQMLTTRRLFQKCSDLEKMVYSMRERQLMMQTVMLEMLKANPSAGVTSLLFETLMQSFT